VTSLTDNLTCPQCSSGHVYHDGSLWICPECGHEWNPDAAGTEETADTVIRDANGNVLADGDTVTVIKDLKVKGSSLVIKGGTKVKGIRLTDGANGHNIACKIDGIGAMDLKSEFVKKA
jgi:protein PhnA